MTRGTNAGEDGRRGQGRRWNSTRSHARTELEWDWSADGRERQQEQQQREEQQRGEQQREEQQRGEQQRGEQQREEQQREDHPFERP